ncbi:hypothetical protein [Streptomyces fragilis]|uniref:Integral membrane protein n=1 Tax=Streptomyces fragilis TaxID=67301 RepID=A0ABV2YDP4_9ACTN|nr:hypothetical protein [Streptomyces fragilis]
MTALHQRTAHTGDDLRYPRAAAFAAVCVVLAGGGHVLASSASHPAVPSWWTWAAGFLLVLAAALPLAGRERNRSLPRITGLLVACQLVLHTLFALGPQSGAAARHGGVTDVAAGGHGAVDTAAVVDRASRIVCGANRLTAEEARQILVDAGLGRDLAEFARLSAGGGYGHPHTGPSDAWLSVLPSLPMLLGHALAGLAAGWLLRRGDLALLRLMRIAGQDLAARPTVLRPLLAALALVRVLHAGLPGAHERPRVPSGSVLDDVPAPSTAPLQHTVIRRGPPASVPALALAA